MSDSLITRRAFLSRGLGAAGGCAFALALGASPGLAGGGYYQRHRAQLIRDFAGTNQGAAQYLAARQWQSPYKQGRPVTQGWQSEVAKIKRMGE